MTADPADAIDDSQEDDENPKEDEAEEDGVQIRIFEDFSKLLEPGRILFAFARHDLTQMFVRPRLSSI